MKYTNKSNAIAGGRFCVPHSAFCIRRTRNGFILPFIIVAVLILAILATGLIMVGYGVRMQAVRAKCQTAALLAAEAGYEQGIFWMSEQPDILGALQNAHSGASGTIDFESGDCSYQVDFDDYIGARPVFRITSTGTSGIVKRVVDVQVVQEVTGWVMGKCRIPTGPTSTGPVNFANGEILDIPIHINNLKDSPDERDIYIVGSPAFMQKVEMGEPRNTSGGADKYASVMGLFKDGIYFDQPNVRITSAAAVQSKVNRFRDSTNVLFRFAPVGTANIGTAATRRNAVQLEFYIDTSSGSEVGMVKITNNCTVKTSPGNTYDYNMISSEGAGIYQKYGIYAYHYAPDAPLLVYPITATYDTQHFGSKESDPGGQIFVNGDVIIGGDMAAPDPNMVIKGKMTVVVTGNIWIADAITVHGARDPATDLPAEGNPNVLGLIAQGVVKIVDPGLSNNSVVGYPEPNGVPDRIYPSDPAKKHYYKPVANADGAVANNRKLPHTMIVEAAVTVGGGGWGAENVNSSNPKRKTTGPGNNDFLVLRGSLSECVRGIVGQVNSNGYLKKYYLDKRLLEGILPGDIWFGGKYVPAPAGWHDYKPEE